MLLQIPITLISFNFFSLLNGSLFYCVIMFRNVFMLQFESSQEITVVEHAMTGDVFRQTQVVLKTLSNLATICSFFSIRRC